MTNLSDRQNQYLHCKKLRHMPQKHILVCRNAWETHLAPQNAHDAHFKTHRHVFRNTLMCF